MAATAAPWAVSAQGGVAQTPDHEAPKASRIAPPRALPQPTSEVILVLAPGADVTAVGRAHGLAPKQKLRGHGRAYVLTAASPQAALGAVERAKHDRRVIAAYPNMRTGYERTQFVPDDPAFPSHVTAGGQGWAGQWHLSNDFTPGLDVRARGAWGRATGSGVTIGIVDDSFEVGHRDLAPNHVAGDSWDFGQNDANPDPVYADDQHGVSVAGVAAARGGNGIGVTGAAPLAGLAGLRIDFPRQTSAMFVDATLYHSSGGNTSIKVKNHSYGYSANYISSAPEVGALETSTAAGTIHAVAAGNDRGGVAQDANKKHLQASPNAVTVAALNSGGKVAGYSCFGANVFVAAPSSGGQGFYGIMTTDRAGESYGYNGSDTYPDPDYTHTFGGTSSATPLVAGVLALVKQVQPNLDTRFAKHLLALTSDVVDGADASTQSDGGWKTNAAGYHFNQNYGFGLINADELTRRATEFTGVSPLATQSTGTVSVGVSIPDNNTTGISRPFTLSQTTPLEEVLVQLSVSHTWRGDVEAYLTSPQGTMSRLMIVSGNDSGDNINWTFTSNAFWGESPAGTWTLKLRDLYRSDIGTWHSFAVTARMGRLVTGAPPPPPAAPTGLSATPGELQVSLSWNAVTGADSYRVKRATTAGGPHTQVASLPGTTWTDGGVTAGTTYYYVVSAVNLGGESPNSSEASATPTAPPPPDAPTGLTATAGKKKVTLQWTPPSADVTQYEIHWSNTSGGPYQPPITTGATTYTHTGLTSRVTYYYVVKAVRSGLKSAPSNEASARPR